MGEPAPSRPTASTPEEILARFRSDRLPDESEVARALDELVEGFAPERLREAIRPRLDDLGAGDGDLVLRIFEAYATPDLFADLSRAVAGQTDLSPERAWRALEMLAGAGELDDRPDLWERWDELNDMVDPEGAAESLADQLEEEPDGSWVALEALGAIEPEVRAEIIASLADVPAGPGLISFLRLLAHSLDEPTRSAALAGLARRPVDRPECLDAWAAIALDHPSAEVRQLARRQLSTVGPPDAIIERASLGPRRPRPVPAGQVVTSVDGSGQGVIYLAAEDRGQWVGARFVCDLAGGIARVDGVVGDDPSAAASFFEAFGRRENAPSVEDDLALALGLLAGSLVLCGPDTNPVLRYWIERTAGPDFRPRPFVGSFQVDDVATEALTMLAEASWTILELCPDWLDRSDVTLDIADEIRLRAGGRPPDPRLDSGAFRFLFEHRLASRLDHYSRMLLWMASFWHASGDPDLARSALALSWQLSDPQNAVPNHPFIQALAIKSLSSARPGDGPGRSPLGPESPRSHLS